MKRNDSRLTVVVLAVSWLVGASELASQERALTLEDFYRFETATAPALSPDGERVAFVRRYVSERENRYRTELWIVPTDASKPPRRLTAPAFDASSPRFSPDGALLAFRSPRPETSSPWMFFHMGEPGDAFAIEGLEDAKDELAFSPDGKWLAFTKPTPPDEPKATPSELEQKLSERFEGRSFDWMQYRYDRRGYLPDPTDPHATPPEELYVLARDGGTPIRVTSLGVNVSDIAFSSDSSRIAFVADMHQRDEYVYERADVFVVDLRRDGETGAVERITDDGYHHSSPVFSPDGTRLAFRRVKGLTLVIQESATRGAPVDVFVHELDSGERTNVTEAWDLRPGFPAWDASGEFVYFESAVGGASHLFRAEVGRDGFAVRQVTKGDRRLSGVGFDSTFSRMVFSAEDASHPSEIFVASIDGDDEKRISFLNDAILGELGLTAPETMRFESNDGTEIEGFLLLPPNRRASGASLPAILSIHGGPHGAYGYQFRFLFHYLAANGYAVVYTNPRGSTGYGEEFLYATWGGGWGNLDSEDVLAGVDAAMARVEIDATRLGVTGYSYGGFLTNWVITHSKRFAAAVVGAGISNWISDYGTADIPRTKESEFFGAPWEDRGGSLLLRQSPIQYAADVTTPTLFIHGESDFRVPIEQGEQMYMALKKRRVPVKFIRYPDSYHGGWTPWNTVHRYYNELSWWNEHLGADRRPTGTSQKR